ncbi:hypothetical protein L1887_56419 [Cichorium endivia]|nr:hypothetical protein L1887_56419 [Cichorium endivia]
MHERASRPHHLEAMYTTQTPVAQSARGGILRMDAAPRLTRTAHYPLRRLAWSDQSRNATNPPSQATPPPPGCASESCDINFCCLFPDSSDLRFAAQYAWRREVRCAELRVKGREMGGVTAF